MTSEEQLFKANLSNILPGKYSVKIKSKDQRAVRSFVIIPSSGVPAADDSDYRVNSFYPVNALSIQIKNWVKLCVIDTRRAITPLAKRH